MTTTSLANEFRCFRFTHSFGEEGFLSLNSSGFDWRPKVQSSGGDDRESIEFKEVSEASSMLTSKGYQFRILLQDGTFMAFTGLKKEELSAIQSYLSKEPKISVKVVPFSTSGYNWGDIKISGNQFQFAREQQHTEENSQEGEEEVFSFDLSEVKGCTINPKQQELVLDFHSDEIAEKKEDCLVQMRFVLPKDEGGTPVLETLQKTIMDRAGILSETGDSICSFKKLPFVYPRGRYDMDFYKKFTNLVGGTFAFNIHYRSIIQMFLLPKPKENRTYFVIHLETPFRLTRKAFFHLVFDFDKKEVFSQSNPLKINLTKEELEKPEFKDLSHRMVGCTFEVIAKILRALSQKRIIGTGTFSSFENESCIKCTYKANEGHLYLLEKSLLYLYKPEPIYVRHEDIRNIKFLRIDDQQQASKSFDICLVLKVDRSIIFANVQKQEYEKFLAFMKLKNISTKASMDSNNEVAQEMAQEPQDEEEEDNEDEEDEDEEDEEDENFKEDDDDDDSGEEDYIVEGNEAESLQKDLQAEEAQPLPKKRKTTSNKN